MGWKHEDVEIQPSLPLPLSTVFQKWKRKFLIFYRTFPILILRVRKTSKKGVTLEGDLRGEILVD
jgi:hypothetical protein